jgi:hypothetical protein
LIHVGKKLSDEPFIIASQASQVFYVEDERHKDWVVVVKTKQGTYMMLVLVFYMKKMMKKIIIVRMSLTISLSTMHMMI